MGDHHEPLRALAPVDWADVPRDDPKPYLNSIFSEALTVLDSIPSATTSAPATAPNGTRGRARAKTDSALSDGTASPRAQRQTPPAEEQSQKLRQEWKEVKVNPRENPLSVMVYKLGAKDGRGAWFARRSVHEGLSFEKWKAGLEKEFIETMKVQGEPGSGSIRGIGADMRVENCVVPGAGHAQVFQLSAQFPGPTSPRDFITLLLTSDSTRPAHDRIRPLREYIIVSKPCAHPECPPRQGIIRGQYESVELIREIPVGNPATKRSLSSADLSTDNKDASSMVTSRGAASDKGQGGDGPQIAIEWLMVTRSDPGGSVPRFMIEKGTPPGIVNDAGKFLNWVTQKSIDESQPATEVGLTQEKSASVLPQGEETPTVAKAPTNKLQRTHARNNAGDDTAWNNNGLLTMITGAFGAASSVVSGGLRWPSSAAEEYGSGTDSAPRSPATGEQAESSPSETSSIRSFTSALERRSIQGRERAPESTQGSLSEDKSQENQPQFKELRRLEGRRRKLDEKAAKMAEHMESKRHGDKEKDAAAMAKAREKHEKELAKNEAKYRRELHKIEEKRETEARKAEARKKKALERDERSSLSLELEKTRAERDVALKQVELLKSQVGDLQAQNTMLASRLGRIGGVERSRSSSTKLIRAGQDVPPEAS